MLSYMTELQERAHLYESIRLKRIEQGIDPDTGERRSDWNAPPETEPNPERHPA